MCCALDLLIPISHEHCFADFHSDSVNCSAPQQKSRDSLLCKASQIFACAHHALYHRPQICHKCMQLLIMLEVPLQIYATTVFVLCTHFQISSTTSKLSCIAQTTTILPPFCWLSCHLIRSLRRFVTSTIFWENITLHTVHYNLVQLWRCL
jgi:hypothetical protein